MDATAAAVAAANAAAMAAISASNGGHGPSFQPAPCFAAWPVAIVFGFPTIMLVIAMMPMLREMLSEGTWGERLLFSSLYFFMFAAAGIVLLLLGALCATCT